MSDVLDIILEDGRLLSVPVSFYPWFLALSPDERMRFEIVGEDTGIWWPAADEGLSVPALLGAACE